MVIRGPGVIKPGTVHSQLFAALDWVPTLVDIAGGPKGNGLKDRLEAGCGIGSWGGRRPSMGGYVTGTGATRGATATGRR